MVKELPKSFTFCYKVDENNKTYHGTVTFSEKGGTVFGNAEDESFRFIMRGEINGNTFYGIWENVFPDGTYAGTFHFSIKEDFSMVGVFTGNTREGDISSGTWDLNPIY